MSGSRPIRRKRRDGLNARLKPPRTGWRRDCGEWERRTWERRMRNLEQVFLPLWNERFRYPPQLAGDAYRFVPKE